MRWLVLWFLLTLTYALGWTGIRLVLGEPLEITAQALWHLATIPVAQLLALALLRVYRKGSGKEQP